MEFFKIRRDIPFMRHALVFNVVSLLTFVAAVFFLFSRGLHLSVEFTGGTLMEVSYNHPADVNLVSRSCLAGRESIAHKTMLRAWEFRKNSPLASIPLPYPSEMQMMRLVLLRPLRALLQKSLACCSVLRNSPPKA